MQKITFDTGVVTYKLGQGVLRFNPSDPNVYTRFSQAMEKLRQLQEDMAQQMQSKPVLTVMAETDRELKQLLDWVFGPGNDFDAVMGGVNLLSVGSDGKRVAEHLLAALEPILLEGAQRCAGQQVEAAKAQAQARRAAQ